MRLNMYIGQEIELQVAVRRDDGVKVPPVDKPVWSLTPNDTIYAVEIKELSPNGTTVKIRAITAGQTVVTADVDGLTQTFNCIVYAPVPPSPTDLQFTVLLPNDHGLVFPVEA